MKKIVLCNHTGSFNRGCDAIIKSTANLLKSANIQVVLAEHKFKEDRKYGYSDFDDIVNYCEINNAPISRGLSYILGKLGQENMCAYFRQRKVWHALQKNVALNVGGDTYCYKRKDLLPSLYLNKYCKKNNISIVFWGCSIENDNILNKEIREDLDRYTYIFPRESITYNNLISAGYPKNKLVLMADPAFTLGLEKVELPSNFITKNTLGINISPLILNQGIDKELIIENCCNLIDNILLNTNMNIALIPHVYDNIKENGDIEALNYLYDKYKESKRIVYFKKFYTAKQLKYIISQCRFLVAARTHASIAAYSTNVPTLVIGYSIKSKGIATDLFGSYHDYVLPVNEIKNVQDINLAMNKIINNEKSIKEQLEISNKQCLERIEAAIDIVKELVK